MLPGERVKAWFTMMEELLPGIHIRENPAWEKDPLLILRSSGGWDFIHMAKMSNQQQEQIELMIANGCLPKVIMQKAKEFLVGSRPEKEYGIK